VFKIFERDNFADLAIGNKMEIFHMYVKAVEGVSHLVHEIFITARKEPIRGANQREEQSEKERIH